MDFSSILYSILILGVLGFLFGILLGFASKKFEVKVDERVTKIRAIYQGLTVEDVAIQDVMLMLML